MIFINFSDNYFSDKWECRKIYQVNIIKKIKKDYKKARKRYQNISKEEEEKKETIWLWTLQKTLRRWKTKACWL